LIPAGVTILSVGADAEHEILETGAAVFKRAFAIWGFIDRSYRHKRGGAETGSGGRRLEAISDGQAEAQLLAEVAELAEISPCGHVGDFESDIEAFDPVAEFDIGANFEA
jgi:hypothetical protein